MVPVLSRATIFVLPAASSEAAVLKRIPFLAPLPLPTIMATGVARPSAQGQLITRTETALVKEKAKLCPASSHPIQVKTATAITDGTKTALTLSAILAIGAFVEEASETIFMICESVVSSPTLVALAFIKPPVFTVAAETVSPSALSTGMLSPVSADSFTAVLPSVTIPSTGIFSPGLTTNMSPTLTSSIPTSVSTPSLSTTAVFGASFIRLLSASVVLPFE